MQKAHEKLKKQNQQLKTLDRMKDGLLSDVTHELSTSVAKQKMQIELLKRFLKKQEMLEDCCKLLDTIEASILRQENVIHNILDLSRLEAGARQYRCKTLRLDKLLKGVLQDYCSTTELHGIEVETDLVPVTITSDQQMLTHVFSNLINNAIKYRSETRSPHLKILVEMSGEQVLVKIIDNGIGLTKKEKKQAFERFYQASASAEGSGIGLTICKKITADLKSRIWLESAGLDNGTTAVVELPLRENI